MYNDLKFALRQLAKGPGFSAVIVVILALGIGGCVTIFSVVKHVLFHSYIPDFEHRVLIRETHVSRSVSPGTFFDCRRELTSFEFLFARARGTLALTGEAEPVQLKASFNTRNALPADGARFALGRNFLPEEEMAGKNKVVIFSHAIWQRVFGGEAGVLGRSVLINGEPHTVIGVTEKEFERANNPVDPYEAWLPLVVDEHDRRNRFLGVFGHLKRGVTVANAQAELDLLMARLEQEYPETNKGIGAIVIQAGTFARDQARSVLWTLFGAVGCLLLISCANVANLMLSRAISRQPEIAMRAALGAARARLFRQLLTESALLALMAGGAGLLLAEWALAGVRAYSSAYLDVRFVELDGIVLTAALGLSLVTALLFGAAPAWMASCVDLNEALKQGSRGSTEAGRRQKLRQILVVAEIACAVVLLAGAGLFIRSFSALSRPSGIVPENATVLRLVLPGARNQKYALPEKKTAFVETVLAGMRGVPGVQAVGLTTEMPTASGARARAFKIEGLPFADGTRAPSTAYATVTPDYFRAIGMPLLRGRTFDDHDDAKSPRVAIINETLSRQHFPDVDPIGRRINVDLGGEDMWREIVGVVADATQSNPHEPITAQVYEPYAQRPVSVLHFIVRTVGSSAGIAAALKRQVYTVDKDQPVDYVQPLTELVYQRHRINRKRFELHLLLAFSVLAVAIAAVGLYAVIAHTVSQRTMEIGIRMALGATASDVARLILSQGGRLVAFGLILGLAGALVFGRVIQAQLYQVNAWDPLTLTAITLLFAAVAAFACWIPARRATKVDPIVALRAE